MDTLKGNPSRRKGIYLTLDDAPSADFSRKVAFLKEQGVPATFFCVGKNIEQHPTAVVEAIRAGFAIGNHSYSHPRFSRLSLAEIAEEITRADALIEEAYARAGVRRHIKLFRYPFGDKGWFRHWAILGKPHSKLGLRRLDHAIARCRDAVGNLFARRVRKVVQRLGYTQPAFPQPLAQYYYASGLAHDPDIFWTFDSKDYRLKEMRDFTRWLAAGEYEDNIYRKPLKRGSLFCDERDDIILMHDYPDNHCHLAAFVELCTERNVEFKSLV